MGYYGFWFIVGVVFWIWVMGFARWLRFQAIQLVCILLFVIMSPDQALFSSVVLVLVWIAFEVYYYRRKQQESVVLDFGGNRTFTQPQPLVRPEQISQPQVHTSQPQQTVVINHHHHYHDGARPAEAALYGRLD